LSEIKPSPGQKHFHKKSVEINIVLSGWVQVTINGQKHRLGKGEFYVLGIFGILGMFVMISGYSLLTIYLGLELLSLSLYAMVAMNKKSPEASEAAIKYFVLGAVASGMLLYGMSIIYGVTGSLTITEIGVSFAHSNDHELAGTIGMVFVLSIYI
jgi:NADH-quinone oxidoreductase subunit N